VKVSSHSLKSEEDALFEPVTTKDLYLHLAWVV